jgi:hypothetical protein
MDRVGRRANVALLKGSTVEERKMKYSLRQQGLDLVGNGLFMSSSSSLPLPASFFPFDASTLGASIPTNPFASSSSSSSPPVDLLNTEVSSFLLSKGANAWSVTEADTESASSLFAISLFPYLALLYFLSAPCVKTPKGANFGFQFLLVFVFATIPAGNEIQEFFYVISHLFMHSLTHLLTHSLVCEMQEFTLKWLTTTS